MRISKKHGLNPTIPLCPYCGESKNEIILTGYEGEKWAKRNGHSDGQMPMHVRVEGDITPCDECKKKGIAVAEVESDDDRTLTGRLWVIREEAIREILKDSPMLPSVLRERLVVIPVAIAQSIGL